MIIIYYYIFDSFIHILIIFIHLFLIFIYFKDCINQSINFFILNLLFLYSHNIFIILNFKYFIVTHIINYHLVMHILIIFIIILMIFIL